MIDIIRRQQQTSTQLAVVQNVEQPDATITLTRTALQAITTAGTLITWQSLTRGNMTWSGTGITIPTNGYYLIQTRIATSANVTLFQQIQLNGTNLGYFAATEVTSTYHTGTTMRYLLANDVIRLRLLPSANVNVTQAAENTLAESPFIHVTQLTRVTA
jgi:hypothetical protein